MSEKDYVFQKADQQKELERLRSIEAVFDPSTQRRLIYAGLKKGSRCLEVGPGAGSIMAWMAQQVGPSGLVKAVDINTAYLTDPPSNVEILTGDIRTIPLEPESIDLIHTRYVLVHIPEFKAVLEVLWKTLKPGGRLVLEEPDFSVARALGGTQSQVRSFEKVHQAILHMYTAKHVDTTLGSRLPVLLQTLGAKNLIIDNDSPISQGGSNIAQVMKMSAHQLRDQYLATGDITEQDLENYSRFTEDATSWAVYYSTIGTLCQK